MPFYGLWMIQLIEPTGVSEHVQDGAVRRFLAIGETTAFEIGHGLLCQPLAKFVEQARLANAGLTDDTHHLPVARGHLLEAPAEYGQLLSTSHKLTQRPSPERSGG